jgi:protein-S-isoprenylcysteine O-methyltransferase Ste14
MALSDEFEQQGEWLFRRRGYLPLALVFLFVIALRKYEWPFRNYVEYAIWAKFCFCLSLLGQVVRCVTIAHAPAGTSGRSTTKQQALQLNTTGMYSVIRHPLYFGNFLIGLGITMAPLVWWLPVMYCLLFCAYYERIMFAEEAFLRRRFGQRFVAWAENTPAFLPRHFMRWRTPALSFSIRNVLRREYTGLIVVILGSAGIQFSEHWIVDHRVVYETFWITLLIFGATSYFGLQALKKRTTILDVTGR